MPAFQFRAVDRTGRMHSGQLDAVSASAVSDELERRGWTALRVAAPNATLGILAWRSPTRGRVRLRDLADLTQELAALLRAGLTIDRALSITQSLSERPAVKALLVRLLEQVREGRSLADALVREPGLPPYYASMVRAGELGGALPDVMTRTGAFIARAQELRERVLSALIYPIILLTMIGVTLVTVLFVVLPRFERLFAEAGATLPWPTRVVLGLGHLVRDEGLLVLAVLAVVIVILAYQWRRPEVKRWMHGRLLRVRVIGPVVQQLDTARFLRTLATLLSNGLTLPSGIRVAAGTLSNLALRDATDQLVRRLREGESLADRLAQAGVYPRIAVQLARVGQETGRLESMLAEAADILDREAQQSLERGLALLVPTVTIAMGLLVAGLIGSVLIGILSLNDLAY